MSHIEKALRRAGVSHLWSEAFTPVESPEPAEPVEMNLVLQPAQTVAVAPVIPVMPEDLATPIPTSFRMPKTFTGVAPDLAPLVITAPGAAPEIVEQYRRLGAKLHQQGRSAGIVMVTSSITGEGKTFTALNLALTLSESFRRRVVLVDADLRRPSVHRSIAQPVTDGLVDVLSSGIPRGLKGVTPNLSALTAGAALHDPISLLTSERLPGLLGQLAAQFDWVVLDTPPVAPLPDAGLLVPHANNVLFVVQAGRTPYSVAQRGIESLGRERITGVVLNRYTSRRVTDSHTYASYYTQSTKERESA